MIERLAAERWIAWVRLAGVAFALLEVADFSPAVPPGYRAAEWALTGVFAAGSLALFWASRIVRPRLLAPLGAAAVVFDACIVGAYGLVYAYEYGDQARWALVLVVVEAALRYGLYGGVLLPLALVGYFWFDEWWRARQFGPPGFHAERISFPSGVMLILGVIVGWLVRRLAHEVELGGRRADEAERLRDELGRRVDVLEAANRCARALGSSLELEQAFGAFVREMRGFLPFERTAFVLVDGDRATTIATAGVGADELFPPGTTTPLAGTVLARVLGGRVVVRRELADREYAEDELLVDLGLHSELLAPLLIGAKTIGMLSLSRARPDAFTTEEVEVVALLGRLVATAVQNIRAYEAERHTVEELRRLSALRADFVSLVSHELRSPMAAVIGAARTLQDRWRTLSVDQREAFLALIGDETNRLAALIGDVLDTSRIEAGTFSYSFSDVDLWQLVEDAVAVAAVGQQDVGVRATLAGAPPPRIRGDLARLRQVVVNLIDNAVKYSPEGDEVEVSVHRDNGLVRISVTDHGPGIPYEQQRRIFEKFGRADVPGGSKPGTGLGLFIARSIAEAHGGSLDVSSRPDEGSTFVLTLPSE